MYRSVILYLQIVDIVPVECISNCLLAIINSSLLVSLVILICIFLCVHMILVL